MLSSGIGCGENPTNARLVHAEAPRYLDFAPALFARERSAGRAFETVDAETRNERVPAHVRRLSRG
jgi:hypothetical protein